MTTTPQGVTLREAQAREIFEIFQGWQTATFGWQGDPDPIIEANNYEASKKAHDDECVRRIAVVLSSHPPAPDQASVEHTCPDCGCHFSGEFPFNYATHTAEPVGEPDPAFERDVQHWITTHGFTREQAETEVRYRRSRHLVKSVLASPAAPEAAQPLIPVADVEGVHVSLLADAIYGAAKPEQQAQAGEPQPLTWIDYARVSEALAKTNAALRMEKRSRAMFVARLEKTRISTYRGQDVLALLDDCDMLANAESGGAFTQAEGAMK